jgi:hypothetical protein
VIVSARSWRHWSGGRQSDGQTDGQTSVRQTTGTTDRGTEHWDGNREDTCEEPRVPAVFCCPALSCPVLSAVCVRPRHGLSADVGDSVLSRTCDDSRSRNAHGAVVDASYVHSLLRLILLL